MEKYVCRLGNAKRLAELGVTRDSYFYWVASIYGDFFIGREREWPAVEKYPAFTVGELGDMLPLDVVIERGVYGWSVYLNAIDAEVGAPIGDGVNQATAFAEAVIWLIENGYVKEVARRKV